MNRPGNTQVRPAGPGDTPGMAPVLAEIVAATGSGIQGDAEFVRARCAAHGTRVACHVAVAPGRGSGSSR